MEVMKALTDRCHECGCSIYRGQGCPYSFRCDDCCRAAGHDHTAPTKPAALPIQKKETVMKKLNSYLHEFIPGLVGSFWRKPDGKVECLDVALADNPMAVARPSPRQG